MHSRTGSEVAEPHQRALGASAHRARDVREACRTRPAGKDELLERRQLGIETRRPRLRVAATCASLIASYPGIDSSPPRSNRSCCTSTRHPATASGSASASSTPIVELSSSTVADRLDARRILGYAAAVAQPGGSGVAGARDDLGQPVTHCASARSIGNEGMASIEKSACAGKSRCAHATRNCLFERIVYHARTAPERSIMSKPYETRSRSQRRQLHAAHAAVADRAHRLRLSAASSRSSTATAATRGQRPTRELGGSRRRSRAPASASATRSPSMAANTPEMIECAFRRADDRRRAQHAQHAPRRRGDRVHARARRGEGADHRHRILADRRGGADARRRRSPPSSTSSTRPGPAASGSASADYESVHRRRRSRPSNGSIRPTNGTRSRSTTRRARPAIPRASSITIAAPISTRCRTSSTGACRGTRCTCGRCRCSTATAGASPGRWRRTPAPTSACARSRRSSIFDAIREHRVTHYCGAPIVHAMLINAPEEWKQGIDAQGELPGRRRGAAGRGDRRHGADRLRHHARLRPDRDLRTGRGLRQARRVGRARHRRAHRAQRPPGRALHLPRRA